jgi:hypothetical protein
MEEPVQGRARRPISGSAKRTWVHRDWQNEPDQLHAGCHGPGMLRLWPGGVASSCGRTNPSRSFPRAPSWPNEPKAQLPVGTTSAERTQDRGGLCAPSRRNGP